MGSFSKRNIRKEKLYILVLAFTFIACSNPCTLAQNILENIIPGQFIVILNDNVENIPVVTQSLTAKHNLVIVHRFSSAIKGFSAHIQPNKLSLIRADRRIKSIEPDLIVNIKTPLPIQNRKRRKNKENDKEEVFPPLQTIPTGINRINVNKSITAKIDGIDERIDVDIAIIDTGISRNHPDLNFFKGVTIGDTGEPGGNDDNGHGSHAAGIAAAIDNDIGVVGVAPGARLWAVKVFNKFGAGTLSGIIAGVDWVTSHADEIDVVNMSLGVFGKSSALQWAIQNSVKAGVVYIAAAGNSKKDIYGNDSIFNDCRINEITSDIVGCDDFIPAAYPEVSAITAIADFDGQLNANCEAFCDKEDTFATYSNYSNSVINDNPVKSSGAAIDLAAPGVSIYSTWKDDQYVILGGTSMAAPHVAGLAALYIASHGKPMNEIDVFNVRQGLIDMGIPQDEPQGFINDRDLNPERLANAGSL